MLNPNRAQLDQAEQEAEISQESFEDTGSGSRSNDHNDNDDMAEDQYEGHDPLSRNDLTNDAGSLQSPRVDGPHHDDPNDADLIQKYKDELKKVYPTRIDLPSCLSEPNMFEGFLPSVKDNNKETQANAGRYYKGEVRDKKPCGKGILKFENNEWFEGQFINGNMTLGGRYYKKDGTWLNVYCKNNIIKYPPGIKMTDLYSVCSKSSILKANNEYIEFNWKKIAYIDEKRENKNCTLIGDTKTLSDKSVSEFEYLTVSFNEDKFNGSLFVKSVQLKWPLGFWRSHSEEWILYFYGEVYEKSQHPKLGRLTNETLGVTLIGEFYDEIFGALKRGKEVRENLFMAEGEWILVNGNEHVSKKVKVEYCCGLIQLSENGQIKFFPATSSS